MSERYFTLCTPTEGWGTSSERAACPCPLLSDLVRRVQSALSVGSAGLYETDDTPGRCADTYM